MIWKRTRHSHRSKQDPLEKETKEADLAMLECAFNDGEIDLYYLDEAGFCLWMPTEYSYFFRGEQKRLEQTSRRGKRLSILGLIQPTLSFTYGLVIGSFARERYIKMMDQQARQAEQVLKNTGRIRVIVQDNDSVHRCKHVKEQWERWQKQGLYFFSSPGILVVNP